MAAWRARAAIFISSPWAGPCRSSRSIGGPTSQSTRCRTVARRTSRRGASLAPHNSPAAPAARLDHRRADQGDRPLVPLAPPARSIFDRGLERPLGSDFLGEIRLQLRFHAEPPSSRCSHVGGSLPGGRRTSSRSGPHLGPGPWPSAPRVGCTGRRLRTECGIWGSSRFSPPPRFEWKRVFPVRLGRLFRCPAMFATVGARTLGLQRQLLPQRFEFFSGHLLPLIFNCVRRAERSVRLRSGRGGVTRRATTTDAGPKI